jgi:hypothetical protein
MLYNIKKKWKKILKIIENLFFKTLKILQIENKIIETIDLL